MLLQQAIKPIPEQDEAEKPFVHHMVDLEVFNTKMGKWYCQCGDSKYVKLTDSDMLTSIRHSHYRHVRVVRKQENDVSEDEGSSNGRD